MAEVSKSHTEGPLDWMLTWTGIKLSFPIFVIFQFGKIMESVLDKDQNVLKDEVTREPLVSTSLFSYFMVSIGRAPPSPLDVRIWHH